MDIEPLRKAGSHKGERRCGVCGARWKGPRIFWDPFFLLEETNLVLRLLSWQLHRHFFLSFWRHGRFVTKQKAIVLRPLPVAGCAPPCTFVLFPVGALASCATVTQPLKP